MAFMLHMFWKFFSDLFGRASAKTTIGGPMVRINCIGERVVARVCKSYCTYNKSLLQKHLEFICQEYLMQQSCTNLSNVFQPCASQAHAKQILFKPGLSTTGTRRKFQRGNGRIVVVWENSGGGSHPQEKSYGIGQAISNQWLNMCPPSKYNCYQLLNTVTEVIPDFRQATM